MDSRRTPVQDAEQQASSRNLSQHQSRPPADVPGYDPERLLGKGSFGEVWMAWHRNSGKRVAIKFITHRSGLDWSLMHREVDKLRLLATSRHVVQLLEVGWDSNPPYYVMDYLESGSLDDRLQAGPLPAAEALLIFQEIAEGLSQAHNKGILHCDLKPANVMLDGDGRPRLADFGQARFTADHGPALGTWFYMAPEQADKEAIPDVRWDVYALGVVLYRMLTGELPYQSSEATGKLKQSSTLRERLDWYSRYLRHAPAPTAHRTVEGVDAPLAEIVERCIAPHPSKRFANMQEVLSALRARALRRARRPVLIAGVLAPIVIWLLMVGALYEVSAVGKSKTEEEIRSLVRQSNLDIADLAAAQVEQKILQRWYILDQEAAQPELAALLAAVRGKPPSDPDRQALQAWLDKRFDYYRSLDLSYTWSLLDADGKMLALSPLDRAREAIDQYFWWRDYFHGRGFDLPRVLDRPRPADVKLITHAHQSIVFRSTAGAHALMVLFSVPVWASSSPEPVGVLTMATLLGDFSQINDKITLIQTRRSTTPDHPDPKSLENQGLVIEHRHGQFADLVKQEKMLYVAPALVEQLRQLAVQKKELLEQGHGDAAGSLFVEMEDYRDPLGAHNAAFTGEWLMVAKPVVLRKWSRRTGSTRIIDNGWAVIAQVKREDAFRPAANLRWEMLLHGGFALGLAIAVVLGIWGFLAMGFNPASTSQLARFIRRRAGVGTTTTPSSPSGPPGSAGSAGSADAKPTPAGTPLA
jgi:hypothetical protein